MARWPTGAVACADPAQHPGGHAGDRTADRPRVGAKRLQLRDLSVRRLVWHQRATRLGDEARAFLGRVRGGPPLHLGGWAQSGAVPPSCVTRF